MIVWLASYPRSGNTFFRILLHKLYGFPNYSVYNAGLKATELDALPTARMVGEAPIPDSLELMAESREVFFVKTHDLPPDEINPAIYLLRDGRDALVSYAHFILRYGGKGERQIYLRKDVGMERDLRSSAAESADQNQEPFIQALHDLIEYNASFGGWGPNALAWSRRRCLTAVVRFEDLIRRPVEIVQRSLETLDLRLHEEPRERVPGFRDLHHELPAFFRKGEIGAWRSEMPADLQDLFWQKNGSIMELFGYHRS